MKFIFKLLIMLVVYNGYSQSAEKSKTKNIVTFSNGDEAITIIEDADTNVIQLTGADDYNPYQMLDLSNHEAVHRSPKKRDIIRTKLSDQNDSGYTLRKAYNDSIEEDDDDSSGGSGA